MKNFLAPLFLLVFITSCSVEGQNIEVSESTPEIEREQFVVWWKKNNFSNIYGNILNNNSKELVAHTNGQIDYLACQVWAEVDSETLIAKISPDVADTFYKNNVIQLNSLREQILNQNNIRRSTLLNFDSQIKQLAFQENDLNTQLINLDNNLGILKNQKDLTGNDIWLQLESIIEQISNLEESKALLEQNKKETLKDIVVNIENLKQQIYNTGNKSLEKLDEIFWVSSENKDENDEFEDFLWAKNSALKAETERQITYFLSKGGASLENLSDEDLSNEIKKLSDLLKDAAEVMSNSIESEWTFSKTTIDSLYNEFLWYSDAVLWYKTNFDKLRNAIGTTWLKFDSDLKVLEWSLTTLNNQKTNIENNGSQNSDLTFDTNINNLENQIDSLKISLKNTSEQITNTKESKISNINQIDIQISQIQDSISRTSVLLQWEKIYATFPWIVKEKKVKEGNVVSTGTPICVIVPEYNSLKLEVYSPNVLQLGSQFKYYKEWEFLWTGSIMTESPVKNIQTQNYTYEWSINYSQLKEGDYLDIVVTNKESWNDSLWESKKDLEIWLPITYVKPRLEWYFVSVIDSDGSISERSIDIWRMNYGEVQVISWLELGDTISK